MPPAWSLGVSCLGPGCPCWGIVVPLVGPWLSFASYEPLELAFFRDLTKETLFLLSLATVRRVGELQAVSCQVAWRGCDVSLSYLPLCSSRVVVYYVLLISYPVVSVPLLFLQAPVDGWTLVLLLTSWSLVGYAGLRSH